MRSTPAHLHIAEDIVRPEELDDLHARERVIAAVERGRADIRAGRVIDDEELSRDLDEKYGPAE